jgi:hypothetical protein
MSTQEFEHRVSETPSIGVDCASPCDIKHVANESNITDIVCPKNVSIADNRPEDVTVESKLSEESSNGVCIAYGDELRQFFTALISQLESNVQNLQADLRVEREVRQARENELGEREKELSALKTSMMQEVARLETEVDVVLARKVSLRESICLVIATEQARVVNIFILLTGIDTKLIFFLLLYG